ncbi:hypothetical protein [Bacillus anthracis]|uniref:Uncharacterized protein n=1 Tax=Bacillus anthracis TaxID=1392 RepID=A0A0J1HJZ7_BACAN|nr:hypothetical protein [Bacillus anthracis]KLV14078.1 hypothetical protein ABW01_28870 [Bacillus anthracis]
MTVDIARFVLHSVIIMALMYYFYIWVIEILIYNKFLYGKYFPRQEDYDAFVKRHNKFNDDV